MASWPGKYEEAWDELVAASRAGDLSAAVVFLPEGQGFENPAEGFMRSLQVGSGTFLVNLTMPRLIHVSCCRKGTPDYGKHDSIPLDEGLAGQCWCTPLYGEPKPWGCRWWSRWIKNIETAVSFEAELQVYFFEGLSLKPSFLRVSDFNQVSIT